MTAFVAIETRHVHHGDSNHGACSDQNAAYLFSAATIDAIWIKIRAWGNDSHRRPVEAISDPGKGRQIYEGERTA